MTATPGIDIYGTEFCSYCAAARMLLKSRGLPYNDIKISNDPEARREMEQRSGRRSVPQIFIGGQPIGGFDELCELDESGELARLTGGQPE